MKDLGAKHLRKLKLANREPLTWACECGIMNILADRYCADCGGAIETCWVEEDRLWAIENIPAMTTHHFRKKGQH